MHRGLATIGAAVLVASIAGPAFAAQPAYLDDRSTADSLVRSFYNAINRFEYSRAYTYFGKAGWPVPYAQFVQGYADTNSVTVLTGTVSGDGAAGSTYYTLPVAIDARSTHGTEQQFAGCYTTRLIQPSNQDPPVEPMYIYKATLHPAQGALRAILPHCDPQ